MAIGPARLGTAPAHARHGPEDVGRHGTRASRAVPSRASCLTKGPGTACWTVFRAGPAREGTACQAFRGESRRQGQPRGAVAAAGTLALEAGCGATRGGKEAEDGSVENEAGSAQRRHVEEEQRVAVRRWPPSAEAGWSGGGVGAELVAGSGVGAELGASALVLVAAEAGLREAMVALDVGSHEKRRGWRGFSEPWGSRSSRRQQ